MSSSGVERSPDRAPKIELADKSVREDHAEMASQNVLEPRDADETFHGANRVSRGGSRPAGLLDIFLKVAAPSCRWIHRENYN
jgi:hypothetical protein